MNEANADQIVAVQQALKPKYGNLLGTTGPAGDGVDGVMGPNTITAIKKFQKDNGLKDDGVVGPKTATKLGVQPLVGATAAPSTQIKYTGPQRATTVTGVSPTATAKTQPAKVTKTPKAEQKPQPTTKETPTVKSKSSGFIILFAFPDYQPSVENNWLNKYIVAPATKAIFGDNPSSAAKAVSGSSSAGTPTSGQIKVGKVGHGGCIVIDADGTCKLYEFGRYTNNSTGVVRSDALGKIASIKDGKLTNAKQVVSTAKKFTEGDGPKMSMYCSVLSLPNPAAAHEFAKVKEREYSTYDPSMGGGMNCGTYSLEVAIKGGANTDFKCFATPVGIVDHVKPIALETFTV